LNGIEAARRIHEALPLTRILVLTMHDEEEYVVRMIRAGASGYILKDGVVSELIAGILAVSKGKPYFAPETIAVRARRAAEAPPSKEDDPYESLTDPGARCLSSHRRRKDQRGDCGGPRDQSEDRGQPPHAPHGEARPSFRRRARPLRREEPPHSLGSEMSKIPAQNDLERL
jgi:hypothetical protein